jgi:hypothetical protein
MKLLKKQKEAPSAEKPEDLETRIRQTCYAAQQYIEAHVDRLKASEEGRLLPRDWLSLNLRAVTRGGSCNCKVALELLEKEKHQ